MIIRVGVDPIEPAGPAHGMGDMDSARHHISLEGLEVRGLLSFGPESPPISLGPLNVLVGANASGKSNLVEVLSILRAAPTDLPAPIREGGGATEWLWKGSPPADEARICATLRYHGGSNPLLFQLAFSAVQGRFELSDESLTTRDPFEGKPDPYIYYAFQKGNPVLNTRSPTTAKARRRNLKREDVEPSQSVLSQRRDPDLYPELTELGWYLASFKLYRAWNTGLRTASRLPQQVDLPEDFLLEDGSNLGLVLNDLEHRGDTRTRILSYLKELYPDVEAISTKVHGGTIQVFFRERGLSSPVPATRLSDGTLRFLSLLVILCHPEPPPLIAIEEPEIGLHPDAIPAVARALVEASERTQLIVTTHSDVLIDALTDSPETVQVVERGPAGTCVRRLEADKLKVWLDDYYLGELWRKGEIGGTRW